MKDLFKNRYQIIQLIIAVFAGIFVLRLAYLQLIEKKYSALARSNAIKEMEVYPTRGMVYDRNGELIVFNEAIYDIMLIPRMAKNVDSAKLCELLNITKEDYAKRFHAAHVYSTYKSSFFMKQVSMETYSRFQEFLYLFPGFYGQVRTIRSYPNQCGALLLGDIGEVSDKQIAESNGYYKPGDYVGKGGIEKTYEKELGGTQGKKFVFVDVHNREQGRLEDGKFDVAAKSGDNVYTSIDIKLQEYGEKLMQNKKGSIVAIEPKTGEILCLISAPTYDPNLLCGAIRGANFAKLNHDSLKPLFNRATMATYPPGSTFKPLVGLMALNEGVQGEQYTVPCNGFYYFAGLTLRCSHHHPWATNIQYALAQSCNPYFWQSFRNVIENREYSRIQDSYGKFVSYCNSFGLGKRLGIDLPSEAKGNIPSVNHFNKIYGEKGWRSSTIISLGIGQGEILVTPLQLCNLFAAIANGGWYYTPHVVKAAIDPETQKNVIKTPEKHYTKISPEWFIPVNKGLRDVVETGTARASRVEGLDIRGKTGTVQNPHGDDHAMFAGYAMGKDSTPAIAIAVCVENAGFGATYSAPIASLIIEKYLNDTIATKRLPIEKRLLETNLIHKYFSPKPKTEKKP